LVQTTLTGGKVKTVLKGACDKREKGYRCGGDLVEIGKNQFRCSKCHKITVIGVLQ
jgi:hypothetical protein